MINSLLSDNINAIIVQPIKPKINPLHQLNSKSHIPLISVIRKTNPITKKFFNRFFKLKKFDNNGEQKPILTEKQNSKIIHMDR